MPPEAWERLICPSCRARLARDGDWLRGDCGHRYPILHGVPHLLPEYAERDDAPVPGETRAP
ncbi:MAG: Trm112 family protein [Deltaproteobacteria bacterium]|nr:MAG: Trm112 family protein [Deltaproteobacteria bacterium]